jgi:DNA-directed RNA polymerase subunit RPC12/RpoP
MSVQPTPVPASIYVAVYPDFNRYELARLTRESAQSIAHDMSVAIARHVDGVGSRNTAFDLYACAVCGSELDTFDLALQHCAIKCPKCDGRSYTERRIEPDECHKYARIERDNCPECCRGFIPDPDEWEYHHPTAATTERAVAT